LTRRKSLIGKGGNFEINPGLDWEPVKLVHEVLDGRGT